MNDIFNDNVPLKTETPAFAKHVLPAVPSSDVYLEDCVKALKRFNDKHFDLAIVDPPYGISMSNDSRFGKVFKDNTRPNSKPIMAKNYTKKEWDNEPPEVEYFIELKRVSKNQIVWGANHFISRLPIDSSCWIVWDKKNGASNLSDCELAWTSFDKAVRKFEWLWNGFQKQRPEERIHPTQKPVALYEWILANYAKQNDLILDTHLGSGSSRIAAYKGGFNFVGFEIDAEYYEKQEKRFNDFKSQLRLF
jgi:site-specific DNA-methyltransferase (adenine-specific)